MSINKSKSNYWLSLHVFYYMIGISGVGLMLLYFVGFSNWYLMIVWILLNGALHWITDYNTSRLTSKLWAKQEVHNFFVVIELDQLIHYICLFGTYVILTQKTW